MKYKIKLECSWAIGSWEDEIEADSEEQALEYAKECLSMETGYSVEEFEEYGDCEDDVDEYEEYEEEEDNDIPW